MKKVFWSILFSLFFCSNAKSQKIPFEQIESMFSKMKADGVNTDKTMLWGYFFVALKRHSFEQIKSELVVENFVFVKTYRGDKKDYWLHLERKEIHNAKSLFELNEKLYRLAEKYEITYDGFDVGNVDPSKAIERDKNIVP
ncbi:ribonuclease E inhibitor RraB [Dyadobacter sp. 22481]|uniref:ribonuclease E inhibitor RraB n=1 Tax=Dyadobacter sp. 22481 TaxID=3453926 RepID=UPI003F842F4D